VATTSQTGEFELVVVDQRARATQHPLSAPETIPRSARLLPGGAVIGFLTSGGKDGVDLFTIEDGRRIARYEIPHDAKLAWPAAEPVWFAYLVADGSVPAGTCRTRLVAVDLLHGVPTSHDVGMCLGSPTWLGQSSIVLAQEYVSGTLGPWVAIDVVTGRIGRAPANSKHWAAIGHTVFYTDGTKGHRSLMALDLERGIARSLTEDLGDVRFMTVEPSSRTVVLTRPPSDVLLYHFDAHRLDRCTIR